MANVVTINNRMDTLRRSALQYTSVCEYEDMQELNANFLSSKGLASSPKMPPLITLQEELLQLQGRSHVPTCPHCGHRHAVKNGTQKNSGLICFKCKHCGKKYTVFTGTVLENCHAPWYVLLKVLEMTINNCSINNMINALEKDYGCKGITFKTVWQWQMKLMRVLANMPQPKLTGVIQIDETYIRESQKGSRKLHSYLPNEIRYPRYGYAPSKCGILGPEFCNVVTAVDSKGHCVCKVLEMGYLSKEKFIFAFDRYIENPTYICTDNNPIYSMYCRMKGYRHYIRPSSYSKILENNKYYTDSELTAAKKKKNHEIKKALYREGAIDKIEPGVYSYEEFCGIKNGNGLSLGRVNALHKEIKRKIVREKVNVCSKYLADYLGFFSFIHNWAVDHGGVEPTSNSDALQIFLLILQQHKTYTRQEICNTTLKLPKPNSRYLKMLTEKTSTARKAVGSDCFKFREEEGVSPLQRRHFLCSMGERCLRRICRENNISGYSNFSVGGMAISIMRLKNADAIISNLIKGLRSLEDEEDEKLRAARNRH